MSRFKAIRSHLSERLSLPEDAIGAGYRLQLFGGHASLSGCRKLLKYSSEEISALTAEGIVSFHGTHLKCKYFFEGTIELSGEIGSVLIEKR